MGYHKETQNLSVFCGFFSSLFWGMGKPL